MKSIGMIHLACYCGAELIYVGNNSIGQPPLQLIQILKEKLSSTNVAFFSSADGLHADCPFCGLNYELPEPELLDRLPYLDQDQFSYELSEMKRTRNGQIGLHSDQTNARGYLS